MSKFEFRDRNLELEIVGVKFNLEVNAALGDRMTEHGKALSELADDIEQGVMAKDTASDLCAKLIDDILGEGTVKKIFTSRNVNFDDCVDILQFIIDEVTGFAEAK